MCLALHWGLRLQCDRDRLRLSSQNLCSKHTRDTFRVMKVMEDIEQTAVEEASGHGLAGSKSKQEPAVWAQEGIAFAKTLRQK